MTKPTPGILGRNLVQAASNSLDQRRNRLAAAPAHEWLEFRKSVTAQPGIWPKRETDQNCRYGSQPATDLRRDLCCP